MRSQLHVISMRPLLLVAPIALFLCVPTASQSGVIHTFHFEGVVTELDVNLGLFGPFLAANVGDPFTGHFSYEVGPSNPDQIPSDPTRGGYNALAFAAQPRYSL